MTTKTDNQIVSHLTTAITAVLSGDNRTAVRSTATALRLIASVNPSETTSKSTPKSTKKSGKKRGKKPLLNAVQAQRLAERVRSGETIVSVAKAYGISYGTAHRYLKSVETSVPQETVSAE